MLKSTGSSVGDHGADKEPSHFQRSIIKRFMGESEYAEFVKNYKASRHTLGKRREEVMPTEADREIAKSFVLKGMAETKKRYGVLPKTVTRAVYRVGREMLRQNLTF